MRENGLDGSYINDLWENSKYIHLIYIIMILACHETYMHAYI